MPHPYPWFDSEITTSQVPPTSHTWRLASLHDQPLMLQPFTQGVWCSEAQQPGWGMVG